MSDKICIFAGTTEGRRLAEILKDAAEVTVCVATEYGEIMLDGIDSISVHSGRMDEGEISDFFAKQGFDRIIDATHPYAEIVTENIARASSKAQIPLMRILRSEDGNISKAVYVSSIKEAKEYLSSVSGNILITTGSKEISDYRGLDMSRIWARVLPTVSSLCECEKAGIPSSHIIAAQGPFTEEINIAEIKMTDAKYLVTKSSGKSGGFFEKIRAAQKCNAIPVIVGQPAQSPGLMLDEAIARLEKEYSIAKRRISLIGIGPFSRDMLTPQAQREISDCDAVFGALSVLEALGTSKPCFNEYAPSKIREILNNHPSIRRAAVVFRGDTGFFSGASKITQEFINEDLEIIPGISSISALCAKLKVSRDNAVFLSLHGRDENFVNAVNRNEKVFLLTGGDNTSSIIFKKLSDYGFGDLFGAVGERLSYPDEAITRGKISELAEIKYAPLSVIYIENPSCQNEMRFGICDDEFIRGDVPMTKSEVRAISLSKLKLNEKSIIWDIGAGTGSVSIECALFAHNGRVFSVEKKGDAVDLIRRNMLKFKADNISIISGEAPDALRDLPAPTNAFIGGSGGNLKDIINAILKKNPNARIVINTVTLEAQAQAFALLKEYGFNEFGAVSVNISRSKKAGAYNLMDAQNPVTVFVMQGGQPSV